MKSIRAKLILFIVLPALLLYVLILGGTLVYLRGLALASVEQTMTRLASNYAGRFDGFLREAAAVAETTAAALGRMVTPQEPDVYSLLRTNVEQRPFIFGACAAFEPGTVRGKDELYAPYVFRKGDSVQHMNITREVYDWYADPQWTWYQVPKSRRQGVWSAPYFDEGAGNILMTTYSAPFSVGPEFRGVTTVDIDLARLRETIGAQITDDGDFIVLAADGKFIYAEHQDWILHRTLSDIARETSNKELASVQPRLLSGRPGVAMAAGWTSTDKQLLFFAPIPSTHWTFVAYMPEHIALAGLRRQMLIAAAALAGTLALIITSIVWVSGRITRPLGQLTSGVRRITGGDLDAQVVGVEGRDEVGVLAAAFNHMAAKLREHVDRLAAEEASRHKLEQDLEIAREIQRGLLPARRPDLPGYDIAGWSQSADQTGGDYYDWQMLEDGTMAVSLADVTGHGIGPALVTAACRAYARASLSQNGELGLALDRINSLLHHDLRDGRFITFVVARIDPPTHRVDMLSAGHGPLFLYESSNNMVREYEAHDIPLGIASDVSHGPPTSFLFSPGDFLVLITDGFFEWANSSGELYGLTRLAGAIRAAHDLPSREIIERIVEDVHQFAAGSKQHDDLTIVILKRSH